MHVEPPDYSRNAFSMVELLVSISIILVLTSLLLPALARSKDKAKQMRCASNSRQLGLGVMLYLADNDEKFPASADYSAPLNDPQRVWTAKVINYVQAEKVFSCPSVVPQKFAKTWEERGWGSYGYTTTTAFDPLGMEGFTSPTTSSMIQSHSLAPLFADTPQGPTGEKYRGFTFDPYNGKANALDKRLGTPLISTTDLVADLKEESPSKLKPVIARHAGKITIIHSDGHTECIALRAILAQESGAGLHWRFRSRERPQLEVE